MPVSQDNSSRDAGPSIWYPGLFCFFSHLLIPVLPTAIGCFPVFPSAQRDTWASLLSSFVHPPSFSDFFPSQILWIPERMQTKIMLPLELQALEVGKGVLEGSAAFDLLGVPKWRL